MGDISKHFNRSEFACECGCGSDTMDYLTLLILERLREHYGQPITITGPNRCEIHNEAVQLAYNANYVPFSSKSTHMKFCAVDFKVAGISPKDVADKLDEWYPDTLGIGRYGNRTHLDSRKIKARWGKN